MQKLKSNGIPDRHLKAWPLRWWAFLYARRFDGYTKTNPIPMHHMQKETRQKHSVSAGFVAGAEGLEPSARGFGVDVGGAHQRAEKGQCCPLFLASWKTSDADLVLRGNSFDDK